MEFEKVFKSIAVVIVGVIAYFWLIGSWNTAYGQTVGNSSNATYNEVTLLMSTSISQLGVNASNATITPSGGGPATSSADLVSRGLGVITTIPVMLGLIPAIFNDGAYLLGIPQQYVSIASTIFIFLFAILFAYLIIIGVRRLL